MKLLQKIKLLSIFKLLARLRLNRFESYNLSCSQFGEDMIVRSLLPGMRSGFLSMLERIIPSFFQTHIISTARAGAV